MKISKGKAGRKARSVYLEIAFWRDGEAIHIAHNDPEGPSSFHVAVRKDGSKPSGHPYLYRELSKCLDSMGAE